MQKTVASVLSLTLFLSMAIPVWGQTEPAMINLTTETEFSGMPQEEPPPDCADLKTGIYVNVQPVKVKSSHISRKFDAYEVSVTNSTEKDVQVVQAEVTNGFEGQEVEEEITRSLIGITSVMGVGGFVLTAVRRKVKNNNALKEAVHFDDEIQPLVLNHGESVSARTLLRKKDTPKLMVTVADQSTGQIMCQSPNANLFISENAEQPVSLTSQDFPKQD